MLKQGKGSPQSAEIEQEICTKIRLLRQERGLSLAGLAKLSGLTYAKLHRLEAGNGRVLARDLFALAQALGIPIDAFFGSPHNHISADSKPRENDGEDFVQLVQQLDSDTIRHRISSLIRSIAQNSPESSANRH